MEKIPIGKLRITDNMAVYYNENDPYAAQWLRNLIAKQIIGKQYAGKSDTSRDSPNGSWWEVEPGMGRVANGVPTRVGRLRAYGNAIVPQVAAEFIKAYSQII